MAILNISLLEQNLILIIPFQPAICHCDGLYRTFYFDDVCPADNSKREIELKSGVAIFRNQFLLQKPFCCHNFRRIKKLIVLDACLHGVGNYTM